MCRVVELSWAVMGDRLRSDHNYRLYSTLVAQQPRLKEIEWQLGSITGTPEGEGWIKLGTRSRLRIRCQVEDIALFGQLDHQILRIGQNLVQLGELEGKSLDYQPKLTSRITIIKLKDGTRIEPFEFGVAVGKKLGEGWESVPKLGERRVIKVHNNTVVGYELIFENLIPTESLHLQAHGLGGKRRMGCGVFFGDTNA